MRPCSNSPCHAVGPEIGRLAPTVKSTPPGSGARLRASIATYSARVSRYQSASPNTRCPIVSPVIAIAGGGDRSGLFVPGGRRRSITAEAIGPGGGLFPAFADRLHRLARTIE